MREVSVQFCYTKEEYVRGVRCYLRHSGMVGPWGILALLMIGGIECFLVWLLGFTILNTAILVLMVMALGSGVYLYVVEPQKIFAANPDVQREVRMTFSEEDIVCRDEVAVSSYAWSLNKCLSTKGFYYLVQEGGHYTMVPKRAFKDENERAGFEQIVRVAVPGALR